MSPLPVASVQRRSAHPTAYSLDTLLERLQSIPPSPPDPDPEDDPPEENPAEDDPFPDDIPIEMPPNDDPPWEVPDNMRL
jgi:hypothetical protein